MRRTLIPGLAIVALGAGATHAAEVVVKSGDTLSRIAERTLGDSKHWVEICETNAKVLGGQCNLLPVGVVLSLPSESPTVGLTLGVPEVSSIPAEGMEVSDVGPNIVATTLAGKSQHRIRYGLDASGRTRMTVEWAVQATQNTSILVYSREQDVMGTIALGGETPVSSGAISNISVEPKGGMTHLTFEVTMASPVTLVQLIYYPVGTGIFSMPSGISVSFKAPSVR